MIFYILYAKLKVLGAIPHPSIWRVYIYKQSATARKQQLHQHQLPRDFTCLGLLDLLDLLDLTDLPDLLDLTDIGEGGGPPPEGGPRTREAALILIKMLNVRISKTRSLEKFWAANLGLGPKLPQNPQF